ncbi:uncharacterized protein LOC114352971 [Ostrinia furnacalis]|uniref:uncharacterized protein LOC114352971 n=1 Tax=Ostrinia furnacalis TaxID=93504 RepID=UPI00103B663C|nr:uncharacterized protein LOC114352971 [Ostrinia furnacalis]
MNSKASLALTATLAALAALAALASAMPTDARTPHKLDLSTVMNKTVCPIKIEIDVDPDRIPKRIKVMKCERDPNQWCSKMHVPKHECCQHQHDNVKLECVEVQDTVQVYYPAQQLAQPYRVSVGCACVMQETGQVQDAVPAR